MMDPSEGIDNFFQKIEKKYSSSHIESKDDLQEQLYILSQEFETLGLPSMDLKKTGDNCLESVVNNTFLLIQLHRKTLLQIRDMNISHQSNGVKTNDLQKNILNLKVKLNTLEEQNKSFERNIFKLSTENKELHKRISMHNRETEKLKQFFKSKQNHMVHQINNLQQENHHLKEMCGKDLDKYFSKEENFLKILKSYRHKEEIYKEAIQKLEDNNTEIMNEILNLKTDLALSYLKG